MLLIYTHRVTPRLTYIFKHIFVRILQVPISFTTKVEEFVAHKGMKMTYSKLPLGDEFFVRSHDLLFDQGINDVEISMQAWEKDVPCFFNAGTKSSIPYDIFAASFYLLSRYEEYLPHVRDAMNCFPVEESLAFQYDFLEKPLVDVWAYKLRAQLQFQFPDFEFVSRSYSCQSVFSICQTYAYKYKGVLRTFGGFLSDLFSLRLQTFWDRILVLVNFKKDPYDTYDQILRFKEEYNTDTMLFFLISNYTTYDNNISITNNKFRLLIKSMSDYVHVGLNASFYTMEKEALLKREVQKLEAILNTPLRRTRQHLLRLHLPETYQHLIDLEVTEEHSMGYTEVFGFRASTCTPFYFYDLDYEIQTPLKVVPFAVSDTVFQSKGLSPKQALLKVTALNKEVRAVDGNFVTSFQNELLSGYGKWKGWNGFYQSVLKQVCTS
jgi:hypothetical protein